MDPTGARSAGGRLGPYELVRPIGRGGAGEVWEAVLHGPAGFARPVALKLLPRGPGDPEALAREARLGALLQHPNVVATWALGVDGDRWYLVTELVRGPSVHELLGRGAALSPAAALEVAIQAAAGLAHVHAAGIVHCDVKPGNLLVDASGIVKLADLGVALFAGAAGAAGGTPGYAPTEQLVGRPEPRSDLFALGVTLLLALTGRRPFGAGAGARPTVERARRVEAELLPEAERALPGAAEVLRRCLALDPAERPPTAAALGAALARLRGAASGPALVELVGRGARPPAPEPAERPTLPASPDRFHGRAAELTELLGALRAGDRLVTVHGLAGAGKSRLALEAARRLAAELPTARVDLAAAASVEALCGAVAAALGVPLARDPVEDVGAALRGRGRALLLLDDLDRLLDPAPPVLARWLEVAPELRLLCTAVAPLRIRGERRLALGPLAPADAVALFRDRGSAPAPDDEVAALVAALDGMPLAIELAAARTRAMPARELRRRLDDRLRVLVSSDRDRKERHRSLEAAIEASAAALGPAAREALAQLAVFAGGFELQAAEAVLDLSGTGAWVPDVVAELVDACFVRVDPDTGRCALPASVAAWAAAQPSARRVDAERRHAAHFAELGGRDVLRALDLRGGAERWRALFDALPDLLAALRRAEARADGPVAAATALAAAVALRRRGATAEALGVLERAAALAVVPWRLPVRVALGATLRELGRWREAVELLEEVRAEVATAADPWLEGEVLHQLGSTLVQAGRAAEAAERLGSALRLFRALGDRRMTALSLASLGLLHAEQGPPEAAREAYREALALAREVGDRVCEGVVLANLALLDRADGRLAEARAGFAAALAVHGALGHRRSEARTRALLGAVELDLGETARARATLLAALAAHREIGDRFAEGTALGLLGHVERHAGDRAAARLQFEEALGLHRAVGSRRSEAAAHGNLARLALDEGDLEAAERGFERALALAREAGDRVQAGVWLAATASVLRRRDPREARRRLAEADALLRAGAPRTELAAVRLAEAEIEAHLGDLGSARSALAEAEELVARLGVGPGSPLAAELERARSRLAGRPPVPVLEVDAAGRFRLGEIAGDLASRHAIRRVLGALVAARRERPGEALGVDPLFDAGWPGERALPDAARERVYHAIGTLRKLGLAAVIERVEGGWRLDPRVGVADR